MSALSNRGCGCGSGTTSSCGNAIAELPRYYPRQMITPDDLTLEQNYFRDRMRRHNRLLHGWGVVCGALVCPATTTNPDGTVSLVPWKVVVQTGYILGPYGDEIILDCVRTVDVRTSGVTGVTGGACIDAPDPWCTQVYTPTTSNSSVVYIAVQYQQTMMRPVRVQPSGCGCGDSTCEYSRWHDGYQIGVLQECPDCNQPTKPNQNVTVQGTVTTSFSAAAAATTSMNSDCPDCSCGPWVGLALVQFDQNGKITVIDNCACRRIIVSLSQVTRSCKGIPLSVTTMTPVAFQASSTATITVTGAGFLCGTTAAFGPNDPLVVTQTQVQDSQTLLLTTAMNAPAAVTAAGTQNANVTLTVTNMDGSTATLNNQAITIAAAAANQLTASNAQNQLLSKSPKPAKLAQPKSPKP
jgi:hypothetical protein